MFAIEALGRASFGGIQFPISDWDTDEGIRAALHEFPKKDGGAWEKLGRKPAKFTMVGMFHDVLNDAGYPDLWPFSLEKLIRLFETSTTTDFVFPGVGPVKAFCSNWKRSFRAMVQSGINVHLEFCEDTFDANLGILLEDGRENALGSRMDELDAAWAEDTLGNPQDAPTAELRLSDGTIVAGKSIFQSMRDAVNAIAAYRDQADLYDQLIEAQVLGLVNMCETLERSDPFLDPRNSRSFAALMALWGSAVAFSQNLLAKVGRVIAYSVPRVMTIDEVAGDICTDVREVAGKVDELLAINDLPDPYAIRAGTRIHYYSAAA